MLPSAGSPKKGLERARREGGVTDPRPQRGDGAWAWPTIRTWAWATAL